MDFQRSSRGERRSGSRRAQITAVVAFLGAAVIGGLGPPLFRPVAGQAPPLQSPSSPGKYQPTEAQWKGLQIAPVETRSFRPERVTEGNIAIDDDLNTPVFSPYSGRVTRLIAKLGDAVVAGAPLFTIEATEFVQAVACSPVHKP